MNVKITRAIDNEVVDANIRRTTGFNLPSITDGWQFNFKKHAKKKGFETYTLVCLESGYVIEGCLTFQMRDAVEPYMAYIEIAPHNRGKKKRYLKVAGCLIAFACRLSMMHGVGHFKGWLTFDVMEEHKNNEIKLTALYCEKYGAYKWQGTTMVIPPETGEQLIDEFLRQPD